MINISIGYRLKGNISIYLILNPYRLESLHFWPYFFILHSIFTGTIELIILKKIQSQYIVSKNNYLLILHSF